jgi:glycosyltransferase involved in cell wall biosynthesis
LRLRDLMVARGIDSRIFVELNDPETGGETAPASTYPGASRAGDVLVYQFATASDLAPWLAARAETLVVNYHNITPPELFAAWDNRLALHQLRARSELHLMAARTALGITVSAFNRQDLDAAGYGTTAVVPPAAVLPAAVPGPREGAGAAGSLPLDRGSPGRGTRWLSVGRMAPNKAIEDVVMALLVARSCYDPGTTLTIVGKPVVASYTSAVHRFVSEVGLEESVRFLGHASDADLAAAYAEADVLVVASGHEGFGVPLIEAMSVGLPIVMSAAGALPEVVGRAGVVTETTDPWALAGAVAELLGDGERCRTLAAAGRAQLDALDLPTAGDRMIDLVCALR